MMDNTSLTDYEQERGEEDALKTPPARSSLRPALRDGQQQPSQRQTSFRLPGLEVSNTGRLSVSFRLSAAKEVEEDSEDDSYDYISDDSDVEDIEGDFTSGGDYTEDASGHSKNSRNRRRRSTYVEGESIRPQEKRKTLDQTLATKETKAVRLLRVLIWVGLAITAIVFCSIVFWYNRRSEHQLLEEQFYQLADQFVNGFYSNVRLQLQGMDVFSLALTSIATESQQVWPFVTVQDIEALGTAIRSIVNDAPRVSIYPLVIDELRPPWEQYAQQLHNLDWINRSQYYQEYIIMSSTNQSSRRMLRENDYDERIRRQRQRTLAASRRKGRTLLQQQLELRDLLTQYTINYTDYPDLNITTIDLSNYPTSAPTQRSSSPSSSPTITTATNTNTSTIPAETPAGNASGSTFPPTTLNPYWTPTTTIPSAQPTISQSSSSPPPTLRPSSAPTGRPSGSPTAPFRVTPYETIWDGTYGTNPHIYRIANSWSDAVENQEGKLVINEPPEAPGPFYPMWQQSPYYTSSDRVGGEDSIASTIRRINYNTHSGTDLHQQAIEIVRNQSQAVFAPGKGNADAAASASASSTTSSSKVQPGASLLYPVFDTIVPGTTTTPEFTKSVTAILELELLWEDFISHILPASNSKDTLLVVISNCQQSFRYEVTGETAEYAGASGAGSGDQPSGTSDFDHLRLDLQLNLQNDNNDGAASASTYNGVPVNQEYCPWRLEIYATKAMQQEYITNYPLYYTLATLLVFAWTCVIFLVYDWLVERRQRKVMKTAVKSDEIVSQLFPNIFRDALYGNGSDKKQDKKESSMDESRVSALARSTTGAGGAGEGSGFHTDIIEEFKRSVGATNDEEGGSTQPMARLYPNCTVFFADIAGFTAWSSARSPAQVFTLLETLYGAFDKLAHRRRVFKIETIGDCYVAVTGLPQPQPSHALLMVKFARDCLAKIPALLKKLATSLGPDTTGLAMRVGLHSGPVTAGVLRGEKARFQLFGDTVNTAARMESNGKRECIHCSQETADILFAAGKGHWVHPRGERIHAKGKGELQTFWVIPSSGESAAFEESMLLSEDEDWDDDDSDDEENNEAAIIQSAIEIMGTSNEKEKADLTKLAEKSFRSIGWTVDLLWSQVKDIAWERRKTTNIDEVDDVWNETNTIAGMEPDWNEDLQKSLFCLANSTNQRGDKAWRVPEDPVREQLTKYVLILALQYKSDAAFHNQEHMALVLVSVDRMLKQLNTILGVERQMNAWAEFTLILAVIIGDINPSSFGINRVSESTDSTERHRYAFEKNLTKAWDLLMKDSFLELRKCICCNIRELIGFQQLLVNLVFAGDISIGPILRDRENRWNEAFRNHDMEESPKNMLHLRVGSILEHISLASQWTHTMQIWETYKKWNSCMFQDICDDYDKGVIDSDPATDWFQQELILFDNIILPMLERLQEANALGATGSELLKCATSNRRSWGRLFLSRT